MKKTMVLDAEVENLYPLLDVINQELEMINCDQAIQFNTDICVEEIFVNIASYSYVDQKGQIEVEICIDENEIDLLFKDSGTPYNPLEKADPDLELSAEDREIGGLGIFMVKEMMDSVDYEYEEKKNCLRIKKQLKTKK